MFDIDAEVTTLKRLRREGTKYENQPKQLAPKLKGLEQLTQDLDAELKRIRAKIAADAEAKAKAKADAAKAKKEAKKDQKDKGKK